MRDTAYAKELARALSDLEERFERTNEELQKTHEELAPYKCSDCGAPLVSSHQQDFPEHHCIVTFDTFACGHQTSDGFTERPCPKSPNFPRLEDYEFSYKEDTGQGWLCYAKPNTTAARSVHLPVGHGRTQEDAERYVRDAYERLRGGS